MGVIRPFVFSGLKGSTVYLIIVFTSLVKVAGWSITFYLRPLQDICFCSRSRKAKI